MTSMLDNLLKFPRITAAAALLLTALSVVFLADTRMDNSLEIWLMPGTEAYEDYHRFTHAFGSEEFVLAAIQGPGIIGKEGLEILAEATLRAADVPGVKSVLSVSPILQSLGMIDEVGGKVLRSVPAYSRLLVSDDGRTVGLYLSIDPSESPRPAIVADLESELGFVEERGYHLYLGGPPVLHTELNRISAEDPLLLLPFVFALTLVLLAGLFRCVAGVVVPMSSITVTVLVSIAACNAAGREFNMITVMFPTILGVLGISQSMHLLIAYSRKRAEGFAARRAASEAVREILHPCFFMSVTTATGFLSLLLSDVAPVRELGLYTAGGILFCFLVNILLGPALLLLTRDGLHVPLPAQTGRLKRWVAGAMRRRRWVLGASLLLVAASIFSASHIGVETNALKFLRQSNPLIEEFGFIQKNLVGLSSLEIDLERKEGEELSACLEKIATFTRVMGKRFPEERVLSVGDFLKAAVFHVSTPAQTARALGLEELRRRAEEIFETTTPKTAAVFLPALKNLSDVSAYITDDASRLRISVLSPVFDGSRFLSFKEEVGKIASAVFGDSARLTGIVPLMVTMQQYLIESQLRCMMLALAVIFVFMVLAARSFAVGLIAMAPNLFPVIVNFGIMGLVGIRLDAATMMIASLALGIAVDNTIHMVVAFRTLKMKGEETYTAVEKAVQWKGRPILYTTLVTCSGFMVLTFSGFLPMAWFGGLMAHTVFWAMVGNLVILPTLLASRRGHLVNFTSS